MVLVERKLFALPETSWLWLATQFLAHDWFSPSHISFEDLSVFFLERASPIDRYPDDAIPRVWFLVSIVCIRHQTWFARQRHVKELFFKGGRCSLSSLMRRADLSSAVDRIEERRWDKGKKEGTCRKPRIFLGTEFGKFRELWKAELTLD